MLKFNHATWNLLSVIYGQEILKFNTSLELKTLPSTPL